MKNRLDPYQWAKKRISFLYDKVKYLKDIEVTTQKHDIWSIKKLLALDYFLDPFINIMLSNDFKELYYVDPFSGSGLIRLKEKYLFPGSPIIPLFHAGKRSFHNYYLSDDNSRYINALENHVHRLSTNKNMRIEISRISFSDLAKKLFRGDKPTFWKEAGYLVFLDPYGLQVDWKSMERILRSGAVDIIFTFMTWAIVWNKNNKSAEDRLTKYFGNEGWKDLAGQHDFVDRYCRQIEELGYYNKYKTFTIDVTQKGGRRYDLILASQSSGAGKVFADVKDRVTSVTTKLIDEAFSVTVGEQSDLDSFERQ